MNFVSLNLNKIEYIKIIYIDIFNEKYEIKTLLKNIEPTALVLEHKRQTSLEAHCPQHILVKFVTNEAMYVAQTKLTNIVNHAHHVDLTITKPREIERRQKREFCRVVTENAVAISCIDIEGETIQFLAKTLDLSAGGVKLTYVKSLQDGKRVENIDFKLYTDIQITLYLYTNTPITFDGTFIRRERIDGNCNYAFEYKNPNTRLVNMVAKYVSEKQIQLKKENKL